MKIELLDAYHIRARLSASIILLAPIVITVFLCFEEIATFAASSAFVCVLLAFTNYIPLLQRRMKKNNPLQCNFAVQLLSPSDRTIDSVTKKRFYRRLAEADPDFSPLENPNMCDEFSACCNSAVAFLRAHTRGNHLVQEESINYGFCKSLFFTKPIGIPLCLGSMCFVAFYSLFQYGGFTQIPVQNYLAFFADLTLLLFWFFGITKQILETAAKGYAKALIYSIDTLNV